jgi:hypothetical protein
MGCLSIQNVRAGCRHSQAEVELVWGESLKSFVQWQDIEDDFAVERLASGKVALRLTSGLMVLIVARVVVLVVLMTQDVYYPRPPPSGLAF